MPFFTDPMKNLLIFVLVVALAIMGYLLFRKDRVGETPETTDTEEPIENVDSEPKTDIFKSEAKKEIKEETEVVLIKAEYPSFGDEKVDEEIKSFVQKEVSTFKSENSTSFPGQSVKNSLEVTYRLEKGEGFTAVVFSMATYTGGAHGNLSLKTFVYENGGERLSVGSLFTPESNYLSRLSELSLIKLKENMGEALGAWAPDGTAPVSSNFEAFYITGDDTLNIIFQPYQVAPWSSGVPLIKIDLSDELEEIVNKDIF